MPGLFDGTPWQRAVTCERCGRESAACDCPVEAPAAAGVPPQQQSPRVRRERRRGKWCAVVADLREDPAGLKALLSSLRSGLGVGGGVSDGELVLQGDCRDAVVERLNALGYRAKPAGG